jgi:hypothetical protein
VSIKVRKDTRKLQGLNKRMKALRKARIKLGIVGPNASQAHDAQSGMTISMVATFHEFGLGVPQRSFLRDWATEEKKEIQRVLKWVVGRVVQGMDVKDALDVAGAKFVGMVQKRISRRIDPPLAASTIARKGSDVPLIDTGLLRTSITWLVELG